MDLCSTPATPRLDPHRRKVVSRPRYFRVQTTMPANLRSPHAPFWRVGEVRQDGEDIGGITNTIARLPEEPHRPDRPVLAHAVSSRHGHRAAAEICHSCAGRWRVGHGAGQPSFGPHAPGTPSGSRRSCSRTFLGCWGNWLFPRRALDVFRSPSV